MKLEKEIRNLIESYPHEISVDHLDALTRELKYLFEQWEF